MNKIPFTSQNPYAFYAKNIDGYDTETNTRKAKKNKREGKIIHKRTTISPRLQMESIWFGGLHLVIHKATQIIIMKVQGADSFALVSLLQCDYVFMLAGKNI